MFGRHGRIRFGLLCAAFLLAAALPARANWKSDHPGPTLDSLQTALKTARGEKKSRLLFGVGFRQAGLDTPLVARGEAAERYARQLEAHARAIGDKRGEVHAAFLLGKRWDRFGGGILDTARAYAHYRRAIAIAKANGQAYEALVAEFALCHSIQYDGRQERAARMLETFAAKLDRAALEGPPDGGLPERLYLLHSVEKMRAWTRSILGMAYYHLGRYHESIKQYRLVFGHAMEDGDPYLAHHSYLDLARVYEALGNDEQQIAYLLKYLRYSEQSKHPFDRGAAQLRAGNMYVQLDRKKLALEYFRKSAINLAAGARALEASQRGSSVQRWVDVATVYENMSGVFRGQAAYDSALVYNDRAERLFLEVEAKGRAAYSPYSRGALLKLSGKPGEATEQFAEAVRRA